MSGKGKGYLCTAGAAVIYGSVPLMATSIFSAGVGPMMLAFLRVLLMIPVFYFLCKKAGVPVTAAPRQIGIAALTGGMFADLTSILLFLSYDYLDTGISMVLNYTYPVMVLLGGAIFFHERITRRIGVCFVLCVAGIAMFYAPGGSVSPVGTALALGSAAACAVYYLVLDKSGILNEMHMYQFALWFFITSTVLMLPVVLLREEFRLDFSGGTWAAIAFFSVAMGAFGQLWYQVGTKELGSRKVSLFSTFEPLTSVVFGALFLHERLTARSVAGVLLVLLSALLLVLLDRGEAGAGA